MRICLMIEGQEGVAWADWVALAQACERLGFDALFRSDHYLSVDGRGERGSLDAWGTVSALSALTSTLRFGTLVSPATFRHPSVLAKAVVTADHIRAGGSSSASGRGGSRPSTSPTASRSRRWASGWRFCPSSSRSSTGNGPNIRSISLESTTGSPGSTPGRSRCSARIRR